MSNPRQAGWFKVPESGGLASDKPRPFGFGLLGQLDPFAVTQVDARPTAPYAKEPRRWPQLAWYDRRSGQPIETVHPDHLGRDPDLLADALTAGVVPLRTIGQILRSYGDRPEHKSLGPDGSQAGPSIAGQLRRRPIRSGSDITTPIGKEGNRLLERATGEITDPADYRTSYTDPDKNRWRRLVLPVLRDIRDIHGASFIAKQVSVSDRQVRNWLNEQDEPHAGRTQNRQRAERLADEWTRERLRAEGKHVPADPAAVLYAYLLPLDI